MANIDEDRERPCGESNSGGTKVANAILVPTHTAEGTITTYRNSKHKIDFEWHQEDTPTCTKVETTCCTMRLEGDVPLTKEAVALMNNATRASTKSKYSSILNDPLYESVESLSISSSNQAWILPILTLSNIDEAIGEISNALGWAL